MKRLLTTLCAGLLVLAPCRAGEALWKPCTIAQLREASDLVVIGRIHSIAIDSPGPGAVDQASLRIERILDGSAPASEVPLVFPGRMRGQVDGLGRLTPEDNPAFIRFDQDQEGIFFLRSRGDGTYSANHPARFKPRFLLGQVLRELTGSIPGS